LNPAARFRVSSDKDFGICRLLLETPERGTLGKHISQHGASTLALQLLTIGRPGHFVKRKLWIYEWIALIKYDG
jgi:hypothetical protein